MPFRFAWLRLIAGVVFVSWFMGVATSCRSGTDAPQTSPSSEPPLQPLVYTEHPDRAPETTRARERRLLRELLQGAKREGRWGPLEDQKNSTRPDLTSPEQLGETLVRGMIGREDASWRHAFVSPTDYARLVRVDLEEARKFVDHTRAEAREARDAFHIERPSEAPPGGLTRLFEFQRLELGRGRTLDGDFVEQEEERVAQHWDNRLHVGLTEDRVSFQVTIPKIVRLSSEHEDSSELYVASDLHIGRKLRAFLEAGLHLTPTLLQGTEYPIPLEVGNYWRYRRRLFDSDDRRLVEGMLAAPDRVTLKVVSVDRYGTRRLVELRTSYNAPDWPNWREHWLLTPRRIHRCSRPCRRHVDDLSWLLQYLSRTTPIARFPLKLGSSWGESSSTTATFRVGSQWRRLDLPEGTFFGAVSLKGTGPLEQRDPRLRLDSLERHLVPGRGIVKRVYTGAHQGDSYRVVEELVDSRILPR